MLNSSFKSLFEKELCYLVPITQGNPLELKIWHVQVMSGGIFFYEAVSSTAWP